MVFNYKEIKLFNRSKRTICFKLSPARNREIKLFSKELTQLAFQFSIQRTCTNWVFEIFTGTTQSGIQFTNLERRRILLVEKVLICL